MNTSITGVHQSDIVVRTAIIAGIKDLRRNPWLLDYVFASLPKDELTARDYGEQEIARAKEWFLRTEIPVFMATRIDTAKLPCISIKLNLSNEEENTLGDVHYDSTEDSDLEWPNLCDRFTPVSYDPTTGVMVVPDAVAQVLIVTDGQVVVDKANTQYPIIETIDKTTFKIDPVEADFIDAVIRGQKPSMIATLESLAFRESYLIGCHSGAEPVHLTYLHSIMVFILLRYKERMLEARGFEKSTMQSSDVTANPNFEQEIAFSRFISITGTVRQSWPKDITQKTTGVLTQPRVIDGGVMGLGEEDELSWLGDQDALDVKFTK